MKRTDPEIETAIVDAWNSGQRSTTRLADLHGLGDGTVRSILRRNGCGPIVRNSFTRKTTTEQDREIVRLYLGGQSANRIAPQFGVTHASVLSRLREAGVARRSSGSRQPLPPEVVEEIVRLRSDGRGVVEIGKMLGVGYPKVRWYLHEAGLPTWSTVRRRPWVRKDGYVMHPLNSDDEFVSMANGRGYVALHRLVMARSIGRPLGATETVHHINGDRADNRVENLQIRQGRHGKHAHFRCVDCGSQNVEAMPL